MRTILTPVEIKGWCRKAKNYHLDYNDKVVSKFDATIVTELNLKLKGGYYDQKFYYDVENLISKNNLNTNKWIVVPIKKTKSLIYSRDEPLDWGKNLMIITRNDKEEENTLQFREYYLRA